MLALVLTILLASAPPADVQAIPSLAADTARVTVDFSGLSGWCPLPDAHTRRTFERILVAAADSDLALRPIGEVVQAVAEMLVGTPYEDGLLDQAQDEVLVAGLASFDCVLFVEHVLALAHAVASGDGSYASYARTVRSLRYRGGDMGDYCSRLHYFSDWIIDNEREGWVTDVSAESGGVRYEKRINFMSQNASRYPALARSREAAACIQGVEQAMASRRLFYIPQDAIRTASRHLQAGDIVATTTGIAGLDVTHTGFVYRNPDGSLGLIHASTSGQVRIDADLARYVQGNRSQTGIIVARPMSPENVSSRSER